MTTTCLLLCGPVALVAITGLAFVTGELTIWLLALLSGSIRATSLGTTLLVPTWMLLLSVLYLPSYCLFILVIMSTLPTILDLLSATRIASTVLSWTIVLGATCTLLGLIAISWTHAALTYSSIAYVTALSLLLTAGIATWDASILVAHGLLNKLLPIILVTYTAGWRPTTDITSLLCIALLLRSAMSSREEILYISAALSPIYVLATVDLSSYTEIDALLAYLLLTVVLLSATERCHTSLYIWGSHILLLLTWAGIPSVSVSLLKLSWLATAGNSSWQPLQLVAIILLLHRYVRCMILFIVTELTGTDDLYRFWPLTSLYYYWLPTSQVQDNHPILFALDTIQVHLTALTAAAGSILVLPTTQSDRQRSQSGRTEALAAYSVLLLAIYLLCLLMSSWASRSISVSAIDLLAVQWYWTAATADINNTTSIELGTAWAIDTTTTITAPAEGITIVATALDVLHSIYLPTILLRADAIPARLTVLSTTTEVHGLLAGQCSELCGPLHGFMAYCIYCTLITPIFILPTVR